MKHGFVKAYRADTGEEVRIPATHLDIFPDAFTTTPPAAAPEAAASEDDGPESPVVVSNPDELAAGFPAPVEPSAATSVPPQADPSGEGIKRPRGRATDNNGPAAAGQEEK